MYDLLFIAYIVVYVHSVHSHIICLIMYCTALYIYVPPNVTVPGTTMYTKPYWSL